MTRTSRVISFVLGCCVALAALGAPALSQDPEEQLREAEAQLREQAGRRDQLTALIAEKEATLARIQHEIVELEGTIAVNNVGLELLADEFERTADELREPRNTRITIAISGFRKGDQRNGALIDEVLTLERSSEGTRRRLLYESVIAAATQRLEEVTNQLADITARLAGTRRVVADAQAQSAQRQAVVRTLTDELNAARADLQDTNAAIADSRLEIEEIKSRRIVAVLTGLELDAQVFRPALTVKVDNVGAAWPQAGINQADIVFVEEVEGTATRLAAVFHSTSPGAVGPVRSMRTSDFDLLAQFNNPLFAHSGGNRGTRAALTRSSLVDAGVSAAPHLYYRSSNRRAPNNLFTNTNNLWALSSDLAGTRMPSATLVFRGTNEPINATAVPAESINIDYGNTKVQYAWNGSGWDRTQNGTPMRDTAGVRTSPTTVIVQFTRYGRSAADSRSPEAITVGSGRALVFTDGHVVEATWSRPSAADRVTYRDSAGRTVSILPGRTWIELPRENSTSYS